MKRSTPPILITLSLVCLALIQNTQAVVPAPDGGYANSTTAEGSQRGQSQVLTLIGPIVGEESDKCGFITESGEDVVWDEASESRWAWE
jgi:hypothetical protein